MSSILKALKKLEHENTTRFSDPLRLDSDILKSSEPSPRTSSLSIVFLLLLVFGCGITVAYFFIKAQESEQTARTNQPVVGEPRSPVPKIITETPPDEIVVVPARSAAPVSVVKKQLPQPSQTVKTVSVRVKKTAVTPVTLSSETPKNNAEPVVHAEQATVITIPKLRVNGIAFQNSSAESMAIVNGTPVSGGSKIEGVTVEEIRKDRVLFQHNGEKFEIQLGQSNQ
jgi:hypothetical protein